MRGVVGEMRVGDMPLHALDDEPAGHAAAAADLDHVAELGRRGRLADDTGIEHLAALAQPFQHLPGAVDRDPLLVPGDQETDRAGKPGPTSGEKPLGGGDEGGDRALHVDGAAAAQHAVVDRGGERLERPLIDSAGRHYIGMPGEAEVRPAAAETGIEVDDRVSLFAVWAVIGEGQPMAPKTEAIEP